VQLTNPVIIFLGIWSLTFLLFNLHLSDLLIDDTSSMVTLLAAIIVPFCCTYLMISGVRGRLVTHASSQGSTRQEFHHLMATHYDSLRSKVPILFLVWCAISVVEIIVSKGIPMVWLLTGGGLSYGEFGIPSLHGMTNSLLLSTALVSLALYFHSGRRVFLIIPVVSTVWSILVISRNLLLVNLLQSFILWLRYYARNAAKGLTRSVVFGFIVLYVFGVVGDVRTGADKFIAVAQPSFELPKWLPSGFFWAYIYITTPLNNMVFNLLNIHPLNTGAMPNTLALLLPSVLRAQLIPGDDDASGNLVTQAFNVSSAFVGPYQDLGVPGVFAYSALCGVVSTIFWYKRSLLGHLGYVVFAQCLFFSNFFNHFLYLPILFQLVWLFFYKTKWTWWTRS
jgi:oligosaccharide repeat unit polymerase